MYYYKNMMRPNKNICNYVIDEKNVCVQFLISLIKDENINPFLDPL